MKKLLLLSLLTLSACERDPTTVDLVNARVLAIQPMAFGTPPATYVKDDHGHLGSVRGIQGAVGDSIQVYCVDGVVVYSK